jgi:hypothetical protein
MSDMSKSRTISISDNTEYYNDLKRKSRAPANNDNPYYFKNEIFIEADKKITSKILKPFFTPL